MSIVIESGEQKILIVGIDSRYEGSTFDVDETLNELEGLCKTAGGEVVGRVVCKQNKPIPATYISKGKVMEISEMTSDEEIDLVVFDVELSPRQVKALEDSFNCGVLDRTNIILDIFALHASSAEGKIAVELAQLEYLLPRLMGMGEVMSNLGAGIGTRGPGETKLEARRRHIRRRISHLKDELENIMRQRKEGRKERTTSSIFKTALVGYTNSGKTTLLNALTGAKGYVRDEYFSTLDTKTRRLDANSHIDIVLTDTVGFISKLPHHLMETFNATLEEVSESDLIVVVLDGSSRYIVKKYQVVEEVLAELGAGEIPQVKVINKIDLLTEDTVENLTSRIPLSFPISAKEGLGLERLTDEVVKASYVGWKRVKLRVETSRRSFIKWLERNSHILDRRYYEGEVELECLIRREYLNNLYDEERVLKVIE